jgi:WD40 repeat protein
MIATRICLIWIVLATPTLVGAQEPTVLKHEGWVAAVAFAPDGKSLASAGADNVVRLWEVGTWKPKGVLKGHTDCVCALAFSEDSHVLVSGSFDGTCKTWREPYDRKKKVWKEMTGPDNTFASHKGPVLAVTKPSEGWTIFGRHTDLMFAGTNGDIYLVGFLGEVPASIGGLPKHKSWVNGIAAGFDKFATASSDGTVRLIERTKNGKEEVARTITFLEGGAGEVRCVSFDPDGKLLAAGNRYGTIRIWDVATRKEVKTLTGHMGDVWSIAFSPDGKTLAAVDTDWKKPSKIKLYDTTTWKERGALDTPGEILSIAYSPKGDWLAAGCWDKTVRVFPIKP